MSAFLTAERSSISTESSVTGRLRLQLQPGSRMPAHCSALGKLLLAFLPARARDRLLQRRPLVRHTPKTVTDRPTLLKQLRQIRRESVSVNDQEYVVGLLGIAVPILGPGNRVVAGLAIHAPTARMDEDPGPKLLAGVARGGGGSLAHLSSCPGSRGPRSRCNSRIGWQAKWVLSGS